MNPDRQLSELLSRAVDTLEPRSDLLVSNAAARGRALRHRRRVVYGATGVALAAMIGTIGVAVWPETGTGTDPAGGRLGTTGQSGTTGQPGAAVTSGPDVRTAAAAVPVEAMVTISPQVLLHTALDLLPRHGDTRTYTGRSLDGWVGAEFVYDDGGGAAQIDVAMGFTHNGATGAQGPCTPGKANSTGTCTVLPDGAHLLVFQGREYPQGHDPYNATNWSVDLVRTDGVEVSMSEWNATQEKDAPITRTDPPFTIGQLTEMVRSARWTPQVAKADAIAVAGLFTPDPPDGPTVGASSTSSASASAARAAKQSRTGTQH